MATGKHRPAAVFAVTQNTEAAALLAEWLELADVAPGDRLFRTRRLNRPQRLDLRVGLRETDGAPCLVIAPSAGGEAVATFETAGLRLSRAADPGGVLLVLSLEEPARRDLFAEICSDCVRSVLRGEDDGESDLVSLLAARLSAWRAFLRDQNGELSRREAIGIVGELLLLDQLLDRGADAVGMCTSPNGGLHDFEWSGHALEAKTSLGAARRLHISTLDQLDEAGLASLHVAHLRLVEAAGGETLAEIADRIEARLGGERARGAFRNALLRRGLAPGAVVDAGPQVLLAGTEFYMVREGFPRLRRGDVALGIVDAEYQLEARALSGFQTEGDAVFGAFAGTCDG
jgi:hypothetical protein